MRTGLGFLVLFLLVFFVPLNAMEPAVLGMHSVRDEAFTKTDERTVAGLESRELIAQLLAACALQPHEGLEPSGERSNSPRTFVDQLFKPAIDQEKAVHYSPVEVQRAWQKIAETWGSCLSDMELLQPNVKHRAIHLASAIYGNLLEKACPAISDEDVANATALEAASPCSTSLDSGTVKALALAARNEPPGFDDAFGRLKYAQLMSRFEQMRREHPSLAKQIAFYFYLSINKKLRTKLDPYLETVVNVADFINTCNVKPRALRTCCSHTFLETAPNAKDSLAAVLAAGMFNESGLLMQQLLQFKHLAAHKKNILLHHLIDEKSKVISSYVEKLDKKDEPGRAMPDSVRQLFLCHIQKGENALIEQFLRMHADLKPNELYPIPVRGAYMATPLEAATIFGNQGIIQTLLNRGANPMLKLTYIVQKRHRTVMRTTQSPYEIVERFLQPPRCSQKPKLYRSPDGTATIDWLDEAYCAEDAKVREEQRQNYTAIKKLFDDNLSMRWRGEIARKTVDMAARSQLYRQAESASLPGQADESLAQPAPMMGAERYTVPARLIQEPLIKSAPEVRTERKRHSYCCAVM